MAIDMSCIRWRTVCGRQFSCGYYDNTLLRRRWEHLWFWRHYTFTLITFIIFINDDLSYPYRYLGLQVGYKIIGIFLLIILGWKAKRTQEYDLGKKPQVQGWSFWDSSHSIAMKLNIVKNVPWKDASVRGIRNQDYSYLDFCRPSFSQVPHRCEWRYFPKGMNPEVFFM